MTDQDLTHDILLKFSEVCKILARSRASIYRDSQAGRFPEPVKLGGSSRWRRSDVLAIVAGSFQAEQSGRVT